MEVPSLKTSRRIPVLTDGAWGTTLQALGLPQGEFSAIWNSSHADLVHQVAIGYVEAGSEIILTNTFGAAEREVLLAGVEISRKAAAGRAKVFGSIGPGGAAEQANILANAGVDGLLVETMTSLKEARNILAAARTAKLPVVVSFAFGFGDFTVADAAKHMESEGASAIGVNCLDMAACVALCAELRAAANLPVWAKPNAGAPQWIENRAVYAMTPAEFASGALALAAAGADYVGGCCGTTAEFIRAARAAFAAG